MRQKSEEKQTQCEDTGHDQKPPDGNLLALEVHEDGGNHRRLDRRNDHPNDDVHAAGTEINIGKPYGDSSQHEESNPDLDIRSDVGSDVGGLGGLIMPMTVMGNPAGVGIVRVRCAHD